MKKLASNIDYNENKKHYFEAISILEELNRSFLESIRNELESKAIFDINPVQAMIVYRIYKDVMSVGDVMKDGYYQGSNATYNLNKLIKNGYIHKSKKRFDTRYVYVALSDKGLSLWDYLDSVIVSQADRLLSIGVDDTSMRNMMDVLGKIDVVLRNNLNDEL